MVHFHVSNKIVLLFEQWQAMTLLDHLVFAGLVFILAVLLEVLVAYLQYLNDAVRKKEKKRCLFLGLASFVYELSFIFRYALMFAVMVHSTLLFVAVVLGSGLGYFIVKPVYMAFVSSAQKGPGHREQGKPEEVELVSFGTEKAIFRQQNGNL